MDAFLLGAGFSRAVSAAMPLTNDLGSEIAAHLKAAGHDVSLLTELFGGDFEAWLTHLADGRPWTSEAGNLRDRARFLDASRMIAQILESRQITVSLPDWFTHLVSWWHTNESVVLTLNDDTLVEEAVQSLHLKDDDGKLVHYSSVYAIPVTSARLRRSAIFGAEDPNTLRLLKLHGSINWYYSGSEAPRGEAIYEGGLTRGWDSRRIEVVGDRSLNLLVDKVPYVVPPTGTKSSFFENETIRAQWAVGNRFCRETGHLVVMGYSLPVADRLMRVFLEESVTSRRITLVNIDPTTEAHFKHLLPSFAIDATWVGGGSSGPIERFARGLTI